ncbi:DUF86 domain-containing protein [Leptolyngbyaceae cyanobacterium CCMR0082]|uniref:DUF86 domain-containing protein n=1 Tax=Adonisia turfae CCMR0082 TaxID=2304604 RepID=A0A6M0SL77_9CYAN|nr:DUF86 domain-containing protein [Adonisia turfae]NEZ68112.1 DUF86 domain-containing protein [Adonisia turfae CCMR0082]
MTNLILTIIANKLERLLNHLVELKSHETIALSEYLADLTIQLATERRLDIIIRSALGINKTILKHAVNIVAGNQSDSFTEMAKQGFIPQKLAQRLAPSASLRYILMRQYGEINSEQIYNHLQRILKDYPQYIAAIQDYLDVQETVVEYPS